MTHKQWAVVDTLVLINILIWGGVCSLLIARSFPIVPGMVVSAAGPVEPAVIATMPQNIAVPTFPFPTDTPLPPESPTPIPTPLPTSTPTEPPPSTSALSPTPVPPIDLPPDAVNILLLGTDTRQGLTSWRTDTIILVAVNPAQKTAGLLSIPRDLWVYTPGYDYRRINTVDCLGERIGYPGGGPALLNETLRYNLGISAHYFIRVDLQGFVRIVDTLGGLDVDVDQTIPYDSYTGLALTPGIYHMDGELALKYVRSRMTTSDFDRSRRQQKVLKIMWQQGLRLNLVPLIPEMWATLGDAFQTDLKLEDVVSLAQSASQIEPQYVKSRLIEGDMVTDWTTPEGAMVLLPNHDRIRQALTSLYAPPDESLKWLAEEAATVEILNGTNVPERAALAAARLRWEGIQVITVGFADRADYAQTLVINYSNKVYTPARLAAVLGVSAENIRHEPDPTSTIDIRVILGRDYKPSS
jgi:LCP family protein required for cell wall assembly